MVPVELTEERRSRLAPLSSAPLELELVVIIPGLGMGMELSRLDGPKHSTPRWEWPCERASFLMGCALLRAWKEPGATVELEVMDEESESASAAAPKEVDRPPISTAPMRGERAIIGMARPLGEAGPPAAARLIERPEAPPPPAAEAVSVALRRICPVMDSLLRPRLGTAEEMIPLEETSLLELGMDEGAKKPFEGGERPVNGIVMVMACGCS